MSTAQAEKAEQGTVYGEVFTKRWVVDVLLDLTGYTAARDLGALRLVEPSSGSGAFLGPAVERLIESARTHERPLWSLGDAIRAYDLQIEQVETSRALCATLLTAAGLDLERAQAIVQTWVRHEDFLLADLGHRPADVAIGNPPYIRYDDLDDGTAAAYRSAWSTMRGRGDIYVGFFERCLAMLTLGGRLGFICADRWMRNAYGGPLRELISSQYAVEHIWTMHDVDAFEAEVSAYPAITVLANRPQGSVLVADTTADFGGSSARRLVAASADTERTSFEYNGVTAHRLPHWFEGSSFWPTGSPARLALIELLTDSFVPLDNSSTKTRVSIGIATGADKAYVTKDAGAVESDRLLPLAMRRDLVTGDFVWQGNYLVNPWKADGSLVDLAEYPRLATYYNRHPALKERFVARKSPATWYRTIDKLTPGLTGRPKLVIQDMKSTIHPVLVPGGYYPHHNLYYIVSEMWDMEVLGGLLLSRVAQAFIEAYCVRMRGGTLRFQAQYLKQIRVPSPQSLSAEMQEALRAAFRSRDVQAATAAAGAAYGIDPADYELTDEG